MNIDENNSYRPFLVLHEALGKLQNQASKLIGYINFTAFDGLIGGFKAGELITLAARPSVGKSSLMLTLAYRLPTLNIPTAVFSLEMTNREIVKRLSMISSDNGFSDLNKTEFCIVNKLFNR